MTAPVQPTLSVATPHPLADDLLTEPAADLIAWLTRVHGPALRALLAARQTRAAALRAGSETLALPVETADVRGGDWQVAPAPADLTDRTVELTGPADPKMVLNALKCGAQVFMADLEDALSPSWDNILVGHSTLAAAGAGTLTFEREDGRVDTQVSDGATLTIRPRGLHLPETHVEVDGRPVPAPLFDVALLATHTAPGLRARGSGLYLYLPKLQSRHEAQWWDAVLGDVERRTGIPYRSIRVTVLIETLPAAFEMEEILFALRDRITGLNAGRWDYLFSTVKTLGYSASHVLPDRSSVTMTVPFLAAYAARLVAVCHRRGAYAIGGMSAFVPDRRDAAATERAFAAVKADKQREAGLGYEGTWVAHPDLVPVAAEAFANRGEVAPAAEVDPSALTDTAVDGAATLTGLRANLRVALLYLTAWLGGRGAVAIDSLMEDAATAEVSRAQVWQWRHHGIALEDGTTVTAELVSAELDAVLASDEVAALDQDRVKQAGAILRDVVLAVELPDFLTLAALPALEA